MPRKSPIKTHEQKARANAEARRKRAEYRALHPLPTKLTPEELKERAYAQSVKSNAIAKAKRDAERLLGIPPSYKPLTQAQKVERKMYQRELRAKYRLLNPVKKRTKEVKPKPVRVPKPKPAKVVKVKVVKVKSVKPVKVKVPKPVKIKPKKMEKILKARPERRISEKVIKPVKLDAAKQPDVVRIKSNEDGKVKVRLNAKTEVWAKPGYVLEDLKRKFGIA